MTDPVFGVPFDDPMFERYQEIHSLDGDPVSTGIAIALYRAAQNEGCQDSPPAAASVITGPSGAAAVQGAMQKFVDESVRCDKAAERDSTASRQLADDALGSARRWRNLPQEPVKLRDGSSQTRQQVLEGHNKRKQAVDLRVTHGDVEHSATRPARAVRLIVAIVLSVIEAALLIWPVTNAAVQDPKSVLYFTGLLVMFFFMNHYVPKNAGQSVRHAREARDAAEKLTGYGVTLGRRGDRKKGRDVLGGVSQRHVEAAERRRNFHCGWLGLVVVVYAVVVFTRVAILASALNRSPMFSLLVAVLITLMTAPGLILLAYWWSRGNELGDQLREYGEITAGSRTLQDQLAAEAHASLVESNEAAESAAKHRASGDQVVKDGNRRVAVGLQKAGTLLKLPSVLRPKPENLFTFSRPVAKRVDDILKKAEGTRATVASMLEEEAPFSAGPVSDPWEHQTAPREAPPNLAFIDPSQLGGLHAAPDSPPPRRRRWWWRRRRAPGQETA